MDKLNKKYKAWTIKAAKELWYGEEVIKKLKVAKTDNEISLIMQTARFKRN